MVKKVETSDGMKVIQGIKKEMEWVMKELTLLQK